MSLSFIPSLIQFQLHLQTEEVPDILSDGFNFKNNKRSSNEPTINKKSKKSK